MKQYIKNIIYGTPTITYWSSLNNPNGNIFQCLYRNFFKSKRERNVLIKWNLDNLWKNIFPFEVILIKRSGGPFDRFKKVREVLNIKDSIIIDVLVHYGCKIKK